MEENREEVKEVRRDLREEKQIRISQSTIAVCMALFALFLFVICKILMAFGVGSRTLYGIFSIFMYGLPIAGSMWSYLKTKKLSFEFWLNVAVFGLVVIGLMFL
ncbi:MAG TPA: hypothetical protein DCO89_01550 [Clostridiales bacterium]|nr:hypothetical protein [Clostridiales bacterium]